MRNIIAWWEYQHIFMMSLLHLSGPAQITCFGNRDGANVLTTVLPVLCCTVLCCDGTVDINGIRQYQFCLTYLCMSRQNLVDAISVLCL